MQAQCVTQGTALLRSHIPPTPARPRHLIKEACPALKIYSLRLPFTSLEEQARPIWDAWVWLKPVWLTLDEGIPQPLPLFPLQAAFMSLGFYPIIGTTWRGSRFPADAGGNVECQRAGFCKPGLTCLWTVPLLLPYSSGKAISAWVWGKEEVAEDQESTVYFLHS